MAQQSPPEPTQVKAFLNGYRQDDGKRPFFFLREQTGEEKATYKTRSSPTSSPIEVTISNGRGMDLSLNKNAFELISHPTALKTREFYHDKEKVTSVYYKEIAQAMQRATGAQFVHIFHHQIRSVAASSGAPGSTAPVQGYANGIHSDSHPQHVDNLFKQSLLAAQSQAAASELDLDLSKGRYVYLNAWRNISSHPVSRDPLAVCDETSLCKPDDYIASDLFAQGHTMQQYKLNARNARKHRWYYFPRMTKDEILLFKQWDSDPTPSGRCCFHTAFRDPTSPFDSPTRESIEVRALCYFPDHEPNTCPEVPDAVDEAAKRLIDVVKLAPSWPPVGQLYVLLFGIMPGGAKMLAKRLVKDERGYFGFSSISEAQKAEILSRMMKSHKEGGMGFADELRKVVPKIFMSRWIGTMAISLLSAGLGWGLAHWSHHR